MREDESDALRYAHETRGTTGLYQKVTSGIVVDDNDPDQYGRVKVRCPMLGDDADADIEDLPWAMMLAPAHGIFDPPPIDTIVGVFCLDGDEKTRVYFGEVITDISQVCSKPHGRFIPVPGKGIFGPYDCYGNPAPAFDEYQEAFRKDPVYNDDPCNPGGGGGGGGGTSQFEPGKGGKNRVPPGEIINYLQEKGMTREQALGAVNNFYYESSFNPGAHGDKTKGHSFGLGQWNRSRGDKMKAFVGDDWATNWKGQIDYMMTERQTKRYMSKDFSSAAEASRDFTIHWEVPANAQRKSVERLKNLPSLENLDTRQPLNDSSDESMESDVSNVSNVSGSEGEYGKSGFVDKPVGKDGTFHNKLDSLVPETVEVPHEAPEFWRVVAESGVAFTPEMIKAMKGGIPDIPAGGDFYDVLGIDDKIRKAKIGYSENIPDIPEDDDYTKVRFSPNTRWFSSAEGHALSMYDDPEKSKITLRSIKGSDITFDDVNGRIRIMISNGAVWLELDKNGHLDIFGLRDISMASDCDINLYAKQTIRMRADKGIHLSSKTDIRLHSKTNLHFKAEGSVYTESLADINLKSKSSIIGTAEQMIGFKGKAGGYIQSGNALNLLAASPVYITGSQVHINSTPAAEAPEAFNAFEAMVPSRIPEHEPWARGYSDPKKADTPGKKEDEYPENHFFVEDYPDRQITSEREEKPAPWYSNDRG
jgi:hypothetical protein